MWRMLYLRFGKSCARQVSHEGTRRSLQGDGRERRTEPPSVRYSNSFDQSETPERTALEWRRVIRPGGYLIFCYSNDVQPTLADRIGGITLDDVRALFPGELVFFQDRGSQNGYSEVMVQIQER